jgi:uncharacterized protein YndB with AHSA1/START domain
MKKIILILVGLVATAIIATLVLAAFQPDTFSVERSASLSAPREALYKQVNNHRNFVTWNPFNELDPDVVNTFSGPEAGVGAVCAWRGNANIGEGSSTITEVVPNELVRMRMDWIKPMAGTSTVDFTFIPEGDKTVVTWKMYGPQTFMSKLCSLFMNPETMCGPMFEKGLAQLGVVASK